MGRENFINVNINVNGTIHKVRIQEGIGIDKTAGYNQNKAWHAKNGSLFCFEEKTEIHKSEYDGLTWEEELGIFTPKTTNELKMTEAEFALFKNMADNVNDGGDVLTLSRADINKAQELFSQGKFTADMTKKLPDGYHGSKESQDMTRDKSVTASISNYDKNKDALAQATGKEYNYENATIKFYNQVEEDKYLEKYAKMSADGSVKKEFRDGGEAGPMWTAYTYKDKDGNIITMSPDYNEEVEYNQDKYKPGVPRLIRSEVTDSEGKHVTTSYVEQDYVFIPIDEEAREALGLWYSCSQLKTSTTTDGKEIIELYYGKSDNFVLKNVVIKYKDGNKTVMELKDENGNPSKKIVDYNQNGKKIHEDYDKDDKLVKKTVDYEENGKKIHEDYDKDNQLTNKTVNYDGIKEIYDGNNNLIEKRNGRDTEYYINGEKYITEYEYVIKCADFDVQGQLDKELSEKAKTYRNAYKNEKSNTIAKAIKDQIEGISGNKKTVAMVKGIPADQFIEVLKEYKNVESWLWFDKASLFTDLMDEWFMDDDELIDIGKQAFACYMHGKDGENVSAEDIEMAKYVQAGPNGNLKEYMLTIEEYVTK